MNSSSNFTTSPPRTDRKWTLVQPGVHLLGQPLDPTDTKGADWQNAWTFHVIFYSFWFSVVSIYSVFGIIRSYNRKDKVTRILAYVIHTLIGFLGLTRLFTLSVFYNEIVPTSVRARSSVLARVVFGLGFPCITAAFALVQFSFTEALKGKLSESKLGNFTFIICIIALHFLVVVTVEILTSLLQNLALLFFATKLYFLIMTAISMVRIVYSGYKVLSQASENTRALHNLSIHYGSTRTKTSEITRRKSVAEKDMVRSLRKVKVIIILTSVFCSVICIMEISSICELAEIVAGKDGALAPWRWYAYQTFFRLAELGMAGTILYTLAPPGQTKKIFEKRELIWERLFGNKQKSDNKIRDVVADDDGHPVAMLNRAYNLGNKD